MVRLLALQRQSGPSSRPAVCAVTSHYVLGFDRLQLPAIGTIFLLRTGVHIAVRVIVVVCAALVGSIDFLLNMPDFDRDGIFVRFFCNRMVQNQLLGHHRPLHLDLSFGLQKVEESLLDDALVDAGLGEAAQTDLL